MFASNICFRRNQKDILSGIDFKVKRGHSAVLVGPNGAGKTTLLRILSGDLSPDTGNVALNGTDLAATSLEKQARNRAVLCQETSVPFSFRVHEIIALGLLPWASIVRNAQPLVEEAAAATDVMHLLHRDIMSLSGGERQRVQLARALAQLSPGGYAGKLLILDEPLSALDLGQERRVVQLLRDLRAQGLTVISVMHDLNPALEIADQVCILREGRLLASCSPFDPELPDKLSLAFDTPLVSQVQAGRRVPLILPSVEAEAKDDLPLKKPSNNHDYHTSPPIPNRSRLQVVRPTES